MLTFIKAVCVSGSRPSLLLPLITTVFARSGFIQRERPRWNFLESRTRNQTSGLLCAVRLQLPLTAAGRTVATGFQGPERPLSVKRTLIKPHTLSLFHSLRLSVSCRLSTVILGDHSFSQYASQYCALTSLRRLLQAPAAHCHPLIYVSTDQTCPLCVT